MALVAPRGFAYRSLMLAQINADALRRMLDLASKKS
jgi:hypothetical protein